VKRVVCGVGSDGRSTILHAGTPPRIFRGEAGGVPAGYEVGAVWAAHALDADTEDITPGLAGYDANLKPGETRFLYFVSPPGRETGGRMHRTDTVDYISVLSGRIWLRAEDGSDVELEAGDLLVTVAAIHQWHNRDIEPCVVSILMLGIPPLGTPLTVTG
jgi:hypothetical protein